MEHHLPVLLLLRISPGPNGLLVSSDSPPFSGPPSQESCRFWRLCVWSFWSWDERSMLWFLEHWVMLSMRSVAGRNPGLLFVSCIRHDSNWQRSLIKLDRSSVAPNSVLHWIAFLPRKWRNPVCSQWHVGECISLASSTKSY
jgi:hypothetical protein